MASDDDEIERAVAALRAGRLVAFPTETVYGLGADAANAAALRRLYAVKGRPAGHPVIVHLARAEQLDDIGRDIPEWARTLARECWPGPLTLVVARRAGAVADEVTGGRETVGVRVPAHPVGHELLARFGRGVAAPSANRFGKVSPTTAAHVRADLGADVDVVLDGGASHVGVESTIVDATGETPRVLRLGGVTARDIAHVTGLEPDEATHGEVAAPGTLPSHYAPHASVRIVTADELDTVDGNGAVVLALHDVVVPSRLHRIAAPRDTDEYARVLYESLRAADAQDARVVYAVPPPPDGVGAAVIDRLNRAASVSVDDER